MIEKTYIRILLIGVSVILIAAGLFNWLVDPYLVWGTKTHPGVNAVKTDFLTHIRLGKAYIIRRLKPHSIVLGSSRAEHGIDPGHPAWGGAKPVYNLALSGPNIGELFAYFKHANSIAKLEQVVVGLDFFMFNAYRENRQDYDESILLLGRFQDNLLAFARMLQIATSSNTVQSSLETLRGQGVGRNAVNENGWRNASTFEDTLRRNAGYRGAFVASETSYLRDVYLPQPQGAFEFQARSGRSTLNEFRSLVAYARANNMDLRLFISPSHARQWEVIDALGLWPKFEQWKRELVAILAEDEMGAFGRKRFELWDFSGYNSISTERIPAKSDVSGHMSWYWDSSHYKKEVGDLVLDRVLGFHSNERIVPFEFGTAIDAINVDFHLDRIRRNRDDYRKSNPEEVLEVRELAAAIASRSVK